MLLFFRFFIYFFNIFFLCFRYSDTNNIVYKQLGSPVEAYENWKECETLERLESIKNNANAIHMESLAIRERILGKFTHSTLWNWYSIYFCTKKNENILYLSGLNNPELPHPIVFRGAIFADNARFDRCIDLWLHALKLRQLNNIAIYTDLLRFAQVFSQMIHVGVDLELSQVTNVLEASVTELSRNKAKIQNPDPKDDVDQCVVSSTTKKSLWILFYDIQSRVAIVFGASVFSICVWFFVSIENTFFSSNFVCANCNYLHGSTIIYLPLWTLTHQATLTLWGWHIHMHAQRVEARKLYCICDK